MPKKTVKTLSKIASLGLASAGLYHTYYQRKYPLIVDEPDEHILNVTKDEAMSNELALDWVMEANYTIEMNEKVVPYLSKRVQKGELKRGDYTLAYDAYVLDDAVATVTIVHGFNEYKEKFQEIIYYLLQSKIQVIIYDQRGHGASKLTPQQTQIDSQNFNEYVLDLKAVIDQVARPILLKGQKLIIFSHSMGGAVTTSYIEQYANEVDGAILNTPMFMIDTGRYPQSFTYLYTKLMTKLGYGRHYIPTTEAFEPSRHTVYNETPEEAISNSQIREEYFHKVNLTNHTLPTQGGSLNWLKTAFDTTHAILKPDRLNQVNIPVLLIRAGEDNVVQKEGVFTAGYYLPNVERVLIPESKHQTYLDHDNALKSYVNKLIGFIYSV
ncbi:alpha/beta fold hydrolase [Fundicoccus sp. Sow4_D5]|uniref:alpha/beta fold hydrolase n=1 Tax=Fundicoccus sp. Sow4_D5 TaxID=3438782 RepID=UPI003F90522E